MAPRQVRAVGELPWVFLLLVELVALLLLVVA